MNQPSKVGPVVLIAFGAVFAGFGLFAATAFATRSNGFDPNSIAGMLTCTIFILIGVGIMLAAVLGNRKLKEQYSLQQSRPDSPWLWRDDWAQSRAESKNRNNAVGLWIAAAFADVIFAVIVVTVIPKFGNRFDPVELVPLGFCLFGVILTIAAIRSTIRRQRFGQTYFEFASLPFSPGRALKGSIHLRLDRETRHGVDLRLECIRVVIIGAGENRSRQEVVLWQDQKNVPAQSLTPGPMGDAVVPVDFTIPTDAYETNHDQLNDQVLWLLHAKADVPGVDYSDDFEVPVFKLESATAPQASDMAFQSAPAFTSDSSDVAPPENPHVVASSGVHGGTEFYFPPFRNPLMAIIMLGVTATVGGVVYALHRSNAPGVFFVIFALFHVLLLFGLIRVAFGSFRIEVAGDRLFVTRATLGMGTTKEFPFADIAQILAVQSGQSVNSRATSYLIRLTTKSGKRVTLADSIANRQEARWVVAQLEKYAGLKLDTHVAVDMIGVASTPPQRGQSYGSPATARWSVALAIGLAIFAATIGLVTHLTMQRPAPGRSPRRPTTGGSRVQRIKYAPMTDRDQQRLLTLSEQAQAEELLERAIQHDTRALDLFEQNIGVWLGDIKLTDRMKQLEWRSRFSSDLRVRYANADVNLAMDGWAKTDNSADLLIARAQSDTKYRPAAVYFMGMLAGRGVAYAELYPVLLEYATQDPDANVRVWAVEGMRYLGSDEALDQLFEIFTHDSSNAVRNRAGCNISDCGNFMRKQRMRMVPRLIDLAADPSTSAQMRSWSFMALNEITDQPLPADASAWRNWYAQHGAEKMEAFERQDWWRVRGDE